MQVSRRAALGGGLAVAGTMTVAACGGSSSSPQSSSTSSSTTSLAMTHAGWQYDSTNDVYYILGRSYVATPQSTDYETLGIYVPGAYFSGSKNADGSFAVQGRG